MHIIFKRILSYPKTPLNQLPFELEIMFFSIAEAQKSRNDGSLFSVSLVGNSNFFLALLFCLYELHLVCIL